MAPKLGRWNDLQTTSTAKSSRNGRMWCDRSPPWAGPRFSPVRQAPVLGAGVGSGSDRGIQHLPFFPTGAAAGEHSQNQRAPTRPGLKSPVFSEELGPGRTWGRASIPISDVDWAKQPRW